MTEVSTDDQLQRERDGWEQSAEQFCRGMEYYRGLLDRVGKALGKDAYTADDGSISEDVLRAKVPEVVEKQLAVKADLLATLKELLASSLAPYPSFEEGKVAQDAWSDRKAKARNDAAFLIAKVEDQPDPEESTHERVGCYTNGDPR